MLYEYTGYTRSDPLFKGKHKDPTEKDICSDIGYFSIILETVYFYMID
jgi:hypothetical protein